MMVLLYYIQDDEDGVRFGLIYVGPAMSDNTIGMYPSECAWIIPGTVDPMEG